MVDYNGIKVGRRFVFLSRAGKLKVLTVISKSDPTIVPREDLRLISGKTDDGQHVGCYYDQIVAEDA